MKKTLFLFLFISFTICLSAQRNSTFYYYKGEKKNVDITWQRVLVGLKNAKTFSKNKLELAKTFKINANSISPAGKVNQLIIHGEHLTNGVVDNTAISRLQKNQSVAYVHPFLLSTSSKLVSYTDEFVAKINPGKPFGQLTALITKHNCRLVKKYPFANGIYIISAGEANEYDALKMANLFFETGLFEYVEPDFTVHDALADAPNDPLYNLQWALKNTGSPEQYYGVPGADMQIDSAWQITMGDPSIKIAVIDTGVDTAHADLKINLLQGFDCTTLTSNPGDGAPKSSKNGHGTACTGIIAAVANNNTGIAGIAPKCKIIPINLTDENNIFSDEIGEAAGFDYAWQNGAAIISNSWYGGLPSNVIDDAIHRAITLGRNGKGSLVFFATGNDNGGIAYPATNPEVIAVGGINMCNQRKSPVSCDGEGEWGANYGAELDVVAPCVKIATTDITGEGGYNQNVFGNADYYTTFNGTSSACPQAAGVAALILSANSALTEKDARIILENTCTKIPDYLFAMTAGNPNGTWNNELGYGRVNAYKAVQAAQSGVFCNVIISATKTLALCKGDTVTLKVATPETNAKYEWRLNGANNGTIDSSLVVVSAGSYDVVATYDNGCKAISAPVVITAPGANKLQAFAGNEVAICPGGNGVRIGGMPSAEGGMPFVNNLRGYGIETFLGKGLMRFNLTNPAEYDFTPIKASDQINDGSFYVGDFTPLGYYVLTRSGNLIRIDTATGEQTFIASLKPEQGQLNGQNWAGLAWDPSSNQLYASTYGQYFNRFYKVNLINGELTPGPQLQNNGIGWIAFNTSGTLFAYLLDSKNVVRINKNTGQLYGSSSNEVGVRMITNLDGAVDPLDGKVYLTTFYVLQKITNDLRAVDTLTNKGSVVGSLDGISQVAALAISGGIYKYSWYPSEGLDNPADANPVANPSKTTIYTLTVTDYCGDTSTSKIKVIAGATLPPVQITAIKDSICVGDTVRLTATQNSNYQYQWMLYDKPISGANDSFYTATRMGDFKIRVTNGRGGCENVSALLQIKDCSIILNNNTTDTTCYSYFYPSKGLQENAWSENEAWTKTIYPTTTKGRLGITFNSFVSKNIQDRLNIYDGPDINAPLVRSFSLGSNPQIGYTYYSTSGPLTFEFTSGSLANTAGNWDAFLSCYQSKIFRSKQSGNFENVTTWQIKDGDGYVDATTVPTAMDDSITIQSGHTVTVGTTFYSPVNQLWIQKGAKLVTGNYLQLKNEPGFEIVADGDIEVLNNGTISGEGSQILFKGNLKGTASFINASIYINGDSTQVFSYKSCRFDSLYLLNSASLLIRGETNPHYLQMNTTGGLYLDSSFNIDKELNLVKGVIYVTGNQPLKFIDPAKLTGGNKNSFINGTILWPLVVYAGKFNLNFPVGHDDKYTPFMLNVNKRLYYNGQQFKISALGGPPPSRNLPAGIGKINTLNYYRIEASRNELTDSVTITLPYTKDDSVTKPSILRILKDDGVGNWVNLGGKGTSADTGTITSDSIFKRYGDFVLAYTSEVLSVNWINFITELKGKAALLTWKINKENNVRYYMIEHSTDGNHFKTLVQLPTSPNNTTVKTYQWVHPDPAKGDNYYRIKQVDKNRGSYYSKIEKLHVPSVEDYKITPNPTTGEIFITTISSIKEINCYDTRGRLLKTARPSSTQYKMLLTHLPAGIYNFRIITKEQVYNAKVLKQ